MSTGELFSIAFPYSLSFPFSRRETVTFSDVEWLYKDGGFGGHHQYLFSI
jgi:hypothetical protein